MRMKAVTSLVLAACLTACAGGPTTPPVSPNKPVRPRASGTPSATDPTGNPVVAPPNTDPAARTPLTGGFLLGRVAAPAGLIANNGGGIVSNNAGGLISDGGGGLISDGGGGLLSNNSAGIIANNSGGLVSNNAGSLISDSGGGLVSKTKYSLLATDIALYEGAIVSLRHADGTPVLGADGKPVQAKTLADGSYALPYTGSDTHVLVSVALPKTGGELLALVPRGANTSPKMVDVDLATTLTMGYILDKFVKGQPDKNATLERLPADVELTTRKTLSAAVKQGASLTAETLSPAEVTTAVDGLRTAAKTLDDQMEVVRKLLIAGLSDQGAGQPADYLETDADRIAIHPTTGEVYYTGIATQRIWKKDKDGKLQAVAGSGLPLPQPTPAPGTPARGDDGPAKEAPMGPSAMAFRPDGRIVVADDASGRIREIGLDGRITTLVAHAEWGSLRDVLVEPDGGLLVLTNAVVWRVPPGGQPVKIAGESRAYDQLEAAKAKVTGVPGAPAAARFANLLSLTRDPRNGDLFVYDATGAVFRITAAGDAIERFAGKGDAAATPVFAGDGGPAADADLSFFGSVLALADGRLLVSDGGVHRLRMVKDGVMSTIAGNGVTSPRVNGGDAKSTALYDSHGLAAGNDGSIYFTDYGAVRRIGPDGVVTGVVGGTRGFDTPRKADDVSLLVPGSITYDAGTHSMVIGDERHAWRWDLTANTLLGIASKGMEGTRFTSGQAALATNMGYFRGGAQDAEGRWIFSAMDPDSSYGRIVRMEANGVLTLLAGGNEDPKTALSTGNATDTSVFGLNPWLAVHDGWVYYPIDLIGTIRRFKPGGTVETFGGRGAGRTDGTLFKDFKLNRAFAGAVGPDNALYVGEEGAVWRVDLATTAVTRVVGTGTKGDSGDGGPATSAQIRWPNGFAWDDQQRLYFSDGVLGCVRRVEADGRLTRVAGSGTATFSGKTIDDGMNAATGLAFDRDGNLYVADGRHGQIKVIPKSKLP